MIAPIQTRQMGSVAIAMNAEGQTAIGVTEADAASGVGYDKAALDEFVAEGTKAWADVPDAAAWVRELRGGQQILP